MAWKLLGKLSIALTIVCADLASVHQNLVSESSEEFLSAFHTQSAVVRNAATSETYSLASVMLESANGFELRSCLTGANIDVAEEMAWISGTHKDCEAVVLKDDSGWSVRELSLSPPLLETFLSKREHAEIRAQKTTLTLEVMSYNVRFGTANDGVNRWVYRRGLAFDVVRNRNPDFVGMQEGLEFQITEFIEEMPQYDTIGVGRDDGFSAGEFSNILYNKNKWSPVESGTFWMCGDIMGPPNCKSHADQGVTRIGSWGRFLSKSDASKYVYIYNFHLDHRSDDSRTFSIQTLLDEIQSRRQRQLSNGQTEDIPVIVTGDFNIGEDSDGVQLMRDNGFIDTFREVFPDETDVGTFHGFTGVSSTGAKIDYVFAPNSTRNGGFTTTHNAEIIRDAEPPIYPSDHWIVDATFSIAA